MSMLDKQGFGTPFKLAEGDLSHSFVVGPTGMGMADAELYRQVFGVSREQADAVLKNTSTRIFFKQPDLSGNTKDVS